MFPMPSSSEVFGSHLLVCACLFMRPCFMVIPGWNAPSSALLSVSSLCHVQSTGLLGLRPPQAS